MCRAVLVVLALAVRASAQVVITEMMAVADEQFRDADGAPSDWIELTNRGARAVSLEGFHLTNSASDLSRWTFPARTLAPGESIIVFASGKDRRTGAGVLFRAGLSPFSPSFSPRAGLARVLKPLSVI